MEGAAWKARRDGSERIRLTKGGVESRQPHWSPDGRWIAYMGETRKGEWHVFQVSADGGTPEELTSGEDQGVPTWSPDGRSLIFGERLTAKPRADMAIHVLDLASKTVSEMPGTRGLWSPRWSPDGRYIVAATSDIQALRVLAIPGTEWKELVRMKSVDNATWSVDSRYVHFNGFDENNHSWLCRLAVASGRLEQLASLDGFDFPPPESWFGVGADGAPLAIRAARVDEIFKLKCKLP